MGIYSNKFKMESAVEDAIQTPDDIGVDLNAVEKAIAGEDGIEGHIEEIEDAQSGVVGDPLEEAYNVMFEAEYNWNQIMYCIGMHELREAANGRDLIYEAADSKGFFAKIKELLQNMFAGITKAVATVLAKLDLQANADKKYVKDNANKIEEGFNKDWSHQGFVFNTSEISTFKVNISSVYELNSNITYVINSLKRGENRDELISELFEDMDKARAKSIKRVSDVDAASIDEMTKELTIKLYGSEEKVELKGNISLSDIIETLKGNRDTNTIRNSYKEIKKDYNDTLKQINKWESEIDASFENISKALTVCSKAADLIKFEKNVLNSKFAVYMKAAKANRSQARALAHSFVNAATKDAKKTTVQHNSASFSEGSIFGSIKLA